MGVCLQTLDLMLGSLCYLAIFVILVSDKSVEDMISFCIYITV